MNKVKFIALTVGIVLAITFTLSCSSSSLVGIYNDEVEVVEAKLLKEVSAQYPVQAKKRGIAGFAKIYMVIDVNGNVTEAFATEVEPVGSGFETEALAAVRQYKFSPALVGGVPTQQRFTREFRFVP